MKRWIMTLVSVIMLVHLSACASAPAVPSTDISYDLSYSMKEYDHFFEIFEEKSEEEWDAMGAYTILLEGLHTDVLVDMNGRNAAAVHAYGQTVSLGADGELFQDCTPVAIRSVEGVVLVDISRDYDGTTFLLTKEKCYTFQPEAGISTQIYVREDGSLAYRRYWGEYVTSFDQWDTAPLDLCTTRDQFLYETGRAEIRDGEVVLTAEETLTVSDLYDLDALFAEAKAQGQYPEYETADDLLAANEP